jgi:hypothetical protein
VSAFFRCHAELAQSCPSQFTKLEVTISFGCGMEFERAAGRVSGRGIRYVESMTSTIRRRRSYCSSPQGRVLLKWAQKRAGLLTHFAGQNASQFSDDESHSIPVVPGGRPKSKPTSLVHQFG